MKKMFFLTVAALFCATSACLADDCNTPTISAATITFTYQEMPPTGVTSIKAKFSVSATKQVYFSQGNLKYLASTSTYRIYDNQWEKGASGNQTKTVSNQGIDRDKQDKWIDLFPWGTGGSPTSTSAANYSSFNDWGKQSIQNLDENDNWRTLTKTEWKYLIERKENDHFMYGAGTLHGVNGMFLFPDNWVMPSGCDYDFKYYTGSFDGYWQNSPSEKQWETMEEAGVIFLPVTGMMRTMQEESVSGTNYKRYKMYNSADHGYYWASTSASSSSFDYMDLSGECLSMGTDGNDYYHAVRLVLDVPTTPAP